MKIPLISEEELEVMMVLWETGCQTMEGLINLLETRTEWKPKYIKKIVDSLVGKGGLLIKYQDEERFYEPAFTFEQFRDDDYNYYLHYQRPNPDFWNWKKKRFRLKK